MDKPRHVKQDRPRWLLYSRRSLYYIQEYQEREQLNLILPHLLEGIIRADILVDSCESEVASFVEN